MCPMFCLILLDTSPFLLKGNGRDASCAAFAHHPTLTKWALKAFSALFLCPFPKVKGEVLCGVYALVKSGGSLQLRVDVSVMGLGQLPTYLPEMIYTFGSLAVNQSLDSRFFPTQEKKDLHESTMILGHRSLLLSSGKGEAKRNLESGTWRGTESLCFGSITQCQR